MTPLVRQEQLSSDGPTWDPLTGRIDFCAGGPWDAVVHLAGENIAAGRWTTSRKARIRSSRVDGTTLLCRALADLDDKPSVVVCASAIGYYGDCGSVEVDEEHSAGTGYLAEVCQAWEMASQPVRDAGIRVAHLRLGVILDASGGALAKMLTPFKFALGGVIGHGQQYMSWVSLTDVVRAILHVLCHDSLQGPINVVAPTPVTNMVFTKTLGRALKRPTIIPMPAMMAKLAFGEMAEELLLSSVRVMPKRLEASEFHFNHAVLSDALDSILK